MCVAANVHQGTRWCPAQRIRPRGGLGTRLAVPVASEAISLAPQTRLHAPTRLRPNRAIQRRGIAGGVRNEPNGTVSGFGVSPAGPCTTEPGHDLRIAGRAAWPPSWCATRVQSRKLGHGRLFTPRVDGVNWRGFVCPYMRRAMVARSPAGRDVPLPSKRARPPPSKPPTVGALRAPPHEENLWDAHRRVAADVQRDEAALPG